MNIKIVQNNELVTFSQCMAITLDEEGGGIYSIKCALQAKNPILTHIKFRNSLSTNLLTNYFDGLFSALPSHYVRSSMIFPYFINLESVGLIHPQKNEKKCLGNEDKNYINQKLC